LHLDIEGGVGERRTTPSTNALLASTSLEGDDKTDHSDHHGTRAALAVVEVALEEVKPEKDSLEVSEVVERKPKKERKKVAFRSDRPDLYDF
jgi:elongator complex protein 4